MRVDLIQTLANHQSSFIVWRRVIACMDFYFYAHIALNDVKIINVLKSY